MRKLLISTAVALALVSTAGAHDKDKDKHKDKCKHESCVMTVPEVDPSSVISGLTLLAGGLAIIRGRRSSKKE